MAMVNKPMFENDPALDWDRESRRQRFLSLQQLENRLGYWRERQEELYAQLYKAATSI